MSNTKIKIVKFSISDISQIIPIHLKAFEGYINASIGKRYVQEFLNWFLIYPKTITLKATFGTTVCGFVVGAPIGYDSIMNKNLLRFSINGVLMNPRVILQRNFLIVVFRKIMLLFDTPSNKNINNPKGKGVSLVGIGVDPAYIGLGIGQQLIKAFEASAIELGMDFMRLSVYDKNLKAIHVYEKCGWLRLGQKGSVFYYFKILPKI